MRIINSLKHLIDIKEVFAEENQHFLEYLKEIATFPDVDEVSQRLSVENFLAQLYEAGIERLVLFTIDAILLTASSEFVKNICISRWLQQTWTTHQHLVNLNAPLLSRDDQDREAFYNPFLLEFALDLQPGNPRPGQ